MVDRTPEQMAAYEREFAKAQVAHARFVESVRRIAATVRREKRDG